MAFTPRIIKPKGDRQDAQKTVQPDFVTLLWLRTVRRKAKKQQQNSIAIVFRFAVAGIFCSKWGSRPKPWAVLCAV